MAKKSKKRKKQQRRHHFVQQVGETPAQQPEAEPSLSTNIASTNEPAAPVAQPETTQITPKAEAKSPTNTVDQQLAERIHYMKRDSRLTAIVAGGILVGLVILWVLFDHTGLGNHIYKLINFS